MTTPTGPAAHRRRTGPAFGPASGPDSGPDPFLRPSVRAVQDALALGPARLPELAARTGYARRTLSGALRELEATGILHSRPDLTDTRHTWFWIDAGPPRAAPQDRRDGASARHDARGS